jgi:hypothetical protein
MRPEEFDHRLQQKLDELNPVFNEQDWIRLSNKMKRNKSPFFFMNRNGMILLLISLLLVGSWMTYHWVSSAPEKQNQNPVQPSDVQLQIANVTEDHEKNLSDKGSIVNPNNTSANQNNSSKAPESKFSKTNSSTQNKFKDHQLKRLNTTTANATKNVSSSEKQLQSNSTEHLLTQNLHQESNGNSFEVKPQSSLESSMVDQNIKDQNSSATDSENQNSIHESSVNQLAENSEVPPIQMLSIEGIRFDDKAVNGRIKPAAGFKTHKWIVGATGLVAASHVNPGIAFEIKTKKNISFGSGLVIQKYLEQQYRDQNEFTAENASDFTELIRPRHSKSVSFSDIKINSTDILLPLNLKYYFPLNSRFALFANASMQLTLASNTSLDFQFVSQQNVVMNETDFEQASNSATLINHFSIGAGIQREFRNFIFQTSFQLQKNNSNQPHITKQEIVGQIGVFYKL